MKDSDFDLIIEPGRVEAQYWRDLWNYKELFYFLSWKDLIVRYKQTVVGILWSVMRPLIMMITFVLVFNKVAKLESTGAPYTIFVLVALLPWQLFSTAFTEASNSLVGNSNLVSKVFFPRMIIPISSVVVALVDFCLSLGILLVFLAFYQYMPTAKILFLPIFLLMTLFLAVGVGLWIAALNVKYRDFRFVVPFIVQFGLYISPIGFSSDVVPERWKLLFSLNPLVGIIDGFRWCFLSYETTYYLPGLFTSLVMTIVLLVVGISYFRSTEKTFADKI